MSIPIMFRPFRVLMSEMLGKTTSGVYAISMTPHDFDGMLGSGLPVSMYTMKTPIDKCRFNVTQLKRIQLYSSIHFHVLIS
jgi:hypothetical protein